MTERPGRDRRDLRRSAAAPAHARDDGQPRVRASSRRRSAAISTLRARSMPETIRLGIIMNGVTGRMGTNQHLVRSICAIRAAGRRRARPTGAASCPTRSSSAATPRSSRRSRDAHGIARWTTDLDAALGERGRHDLLRRGVDRAAAGADPQGASPRASTSTPRSRSRRRSPRRSTCTGRAEAAGVKHGVVQDKLWLPGLLKLKMLIDAGFFGRILSVRGEFGYWVFEGDWQPAQRPSWNYRKEDDGGIIVDMLCHWRYVLDNLFGAVKSVLVPRRDAHPEALGRAGTPIRGDRRRRRVRDASSSQAAGPDHRADQQLVVHARAPRRPRHVPRRRHARLGRRRPHRLPDPAARRRRRKPVWNPDVPQTIDFFDTWQKVPDNRAYDNAFKVEWELFLRHVVDGAPFRWNLLEGAKGVQLAEARPAELARAALGRRAGACRLVTAMTTLEPSARRRHARIRTRCARLCAGHDLRAGSRAGTASPSRPRTSSPIRSRRSIHGCEPRSTGTRRSPTAAICGRSASASPRRWTPRSAAWGSTGRPRSS